MKTQLVSAIHLQELEEEGEREEERETAAKPAAEPAAEPVEEARGNHFRLSNSEFTPMVAIKLGTLYIFPFTINQGHIYNRSNRLPCSYFFFLTIKKIIRPYMPEKLRPRVRLQ